MKISTFLRSYDGGTFWIPAKNWSYLFFSFRMSSSSLSSSSSCLITVGAYNTRSKGNMTKTGAPSAHSGLDTLRSIPAVERVLSADAYASLVEDFGRERVKEAV